MTRQPDDSDDSGFHRFNYTTYDLDMRDWCALLRAYRALRIAMYAPISYTGWDQPCSQGWYGLSREEARRRVIEFGREWSWMTYLGSK